MVPRCITSAKQFALRGLSGGGDPGPGQPPAAGAARRRRSCIAPWSLLRDRNSKLPFAVGSEAKNVFIIGQRRFIPDQAEVTPSKREQAALGAIDNRPSLHSAMAYTGPRGNPRSGSRALVNDWRHGTLRISARRAGNAARQAARKTVRMRRSRKKFEFLNDHLDIDVAKGCVEV